jgi:hypothetical protein
LPDGGLETVEAPPELTAPPAPHRASYLQPIIGVAPDREAD